ncbi:hypothetical protein R5R35_007467 [Gryllus longicercus]|uniref:Uncharacterized protein n=1 Tax=Gryllus longicercus TaxID=2509291 RepID=A0AAN9YVA7_9ORTH
MLAVMEQSPDANHDPVQDFLSSGRTGRRNAMPDILGEHASTSTAELPARLQQLNTTTAGVSGDASNAATPVGAGPASLLQPGGGGGASSPAATPGAAPAPPTPTPSAPAAAASAAGAPAASS